MDIKSAFIWLLLSILVLVESRVYRQHKGTPAVLANLNFTTIKINSKGERELRISYDGILFMEIMTVEMGEYGLFLRQVTDGKHLVTSVFDGREIFIDCDVERSKADRLRFYKKFYSFVTNEDSDFSHYLKSGSVESHQNKTGNFTFEITSNEIEEQYKHLVDIDTQRADCKRLHHTLLREYKKKMQEGRVADENNILNKDNLSRFRKLIGFVGNLEYLEYHKDLTEDTVVGGVGTDAEDKLEDAKGDEKVNSSQENIKHHQHPKEQKPGEHIGERGGHHPEHKDGEKPHHKKTHSKHHKGQGHHHSTSHHHGETSPDLKRTHQAMDPETGYPSWESAYNAHLNSTVLHKRNKRAMFIYPGTNWCGSGNTAKHYDDLGEEAETDKCCRAHDHCPHTITGFNKGYGLFNYRFHTLSKCECDELFKGCLKGAGTSVADMIGSIYFNYMGTKCFKLKRHQTCIKRSWWGYCIKNKNDYTGVMKAALEF